MPQRTNVVTGARSGIGRATTELLRARGERVIGIDIGDCDVVADLSTAAGRAHAIERVSAMGAGAIDSLIACAGLSTSDGPAVVSVNYFGTVAIAEGLRPLFSRGDAPRVVIVSSSASLGPHDEAIAAACLDGDENRARLLAAADTEDDAKARLGPIYAATKRAVSRWIRRTAPRVEWAGAGILLNGVAPGLVVTPMTAPMLATPEGRDVLARAVPRAVADPAQPRDLALLLAFLASPDNRYLVGQVPFCDGGTDVIVRGDAFF